MRWISRRAAPNAGRGAATLRPGSDMSDDRTKSGKRDRVRVRSKPAPPGNDRDRQNGEARGDHGNDRLPSFTVDGSPESGAVFAKFLDLVRRRRAIIATTIVLGVALCLALGIALPRTYAAKALLLVGPLPAQSSGAVRSPNEEADEVFLQTEMSTLSSRQHLRAVAAALDVSDPEIADRLARVGWLNAIGDRAFGTAERWIEDLRSAGPAADASPPAEARAAEVNSPEANSPEVNSAASIAADRRERQLNQLEKNLRITQELRSRIISVRYTASTPDAAALIANAMVNVHIDDHIALSKQYLQRELDWTDQALGQERLKLDQANEAVADFIARNVVPDDARTRAIEQQTFALRHQLSSAQADLDAAVDRVEQVRLLQSRAGDWDYLATKTEFPRLVQLALAVKNAGPPAGPEAEAIRVRAKGTDARRPSEERARLEFASALDETERDLHDRVQMATARREAARQALASIETSRVDNARIAMAIADLRRKAADAHAAYQNRQQTRSKLEERLSVYTPGLRMVSAAAPPLHPSSPHPLYFIPPAFVASLILGCVLALAVDQNDRRLRTRSDVETALAIPCIGVLPRVPSWRAGSLGRGGSRPNDRATGAVRSMALACLRRGDRRDRLRSIAIVSPSSADDAADVAAALARVTQTFGRRTLYLDLHRSRWSLQAWPGAKHPSLSDALEGRCEPMAAVRSLGRRGPDVLGGSIADIDRLDAFADGRIATFLGALARSYDLLVIHAPPLQESVAASWIAAETDLILFVVRSGITDRRVAAVQLRQLRSNAGYAAQAPEILGILDQASERSAT